MNSPAKVFAIILGVIVAYFAIHFVVTAVFGVIAGVFGFLFHVALPLLMVVGIGYGLYRVFSPRALGGSRRILP